MNTQPVHDPETGDLRGSAETVAMPGDISAGNQPNIDMDDMRGLEPESATDPQQHKKGMIIAGVAVAALIGGLGIFSYASGTWDTGPAAPARVIVAANTVAPALPAVVPPAAPTPVPSVAIEGPPAVAPVAAPAPIAAPVVKRAAAPKPAMRALPQRAIAPPEIMPVPPVTAVPAEADAISTTPPVIAPTPPVQSLPDEPAPQPAPATPASQTPPEQPPQ